MPSACKCPPWPMPERSSKAGVATEPADRITSRRAVMMVSAPCARTRMPMALRSSKRICSTSAPVNSFKLRRPSAGFRKARWWPVDDYEQRQGAPIRAQVELFAKSPNLGTLSFSVERLLQEGYGDNSSILDYPKNAQLALVRR